MDQRFHGYLPPAGLVENHSLAVPSKHPNTIARPSGEKATDLNGAVWLFSVSSSCPVLASQSLAVVSPPLVRIRCPSGE